jgi:hypothetical protein
MSFCRGPMLFIGPKDPHGLGPVKTNADPSPKNRARVDVGAGSVHHRYYA